MNLRPYQTAAVEAVERGWGEFQRQLVVMPTGVGKTICFAHLAAREAARGGNTMILAHRDELLQQAQDKIRVAVGMDSALEKADSIAYDGLFRKPITVASVQTLHAKRLEKWAPDAVDLLVVDEAHHALSDSYRAIINHFSNARVLGVTATPDRGDKRDMGEVFEGIAYEYSIRDAIADGYLSPIAAELIPIKIDLSKVRTMAGDYNVADLDESLLPYLDTVAREVASHVVARKTLIFLPLVRTSQAFAKLLRDYGISAEHIDGASPDRADILKRYAASEFQALCNSALLFEGYDQPDISCVVPLRPTQSRPLYCLDSQTELLTPSGWKLNVEVGDDVAAWNKETGEIRFTPAIAQTRRFLYPDEHFISLVSQSVDIRVSNKHRMIYDNRRRNGWKFTEVSRLASLRDTSYIPVAGCASTPGVPLSNDELRFIGWVMTDGSINKHNGGIAITQGEHQPWLEDIQKCIDGCGFKYNRFVRVRCGAFKANSDCVTWTISKGVPRGRDKHLRGWGALEPWLSKDFAPALMAVNNKQFDVLLKAIHLGDGLKQKSLNWTQRSYHISKGNKAFIERLQICALMHGYRANISAVKVLPGRQPLYYLHLKKQEWSRVGGQRGDRPSWKIEPHSKEECWCVENEFGTLVTRHNGKVAIVSNCQMVGRGTRIFPGKENLLVLDFLWQTTKHKLCQPASLFAHSVEEADSIMAQVIPGGGQIDLLEAEADAKKQREESLRKKLQETQKKQRRSIDPVSFALSIDCMDLAEWEPEAAWHEKTVTDGQRKALSNFGIDLATVTCRGHASAILDVIFARRQAGLCTPKQAAVLNKYGYSSNTSFEEAKGLIDTIAANGWQRPILVVAAPLPLDY